MFFHERIFVMKRRIALILAILMLVGSLFSVLSFAEGEAAPEVTPEAESYTDLKIAYANLNYTDKIYMKFAVPAYADLPADAKVELIIWDSNNIDDSFLYSDTISDDTNVATAITLAPEADKATINGAEHFVFIYEELTIEKMTDVVYVRPAITLNDGRVVYGEVINYSILEYVVAAKGGFEGIAPIEDQEHLALLDTMLDFGALAQNYLGDGGAYLPGGFYANDEVQKIWITPVIAGVPGEKIFSGFYKPGADFASIHKMPLGVYVAGAITDLDGKTLTDGDIDLAGIQVEAPAEGDLVVKCSYDYDYMYKSTLNMVDTSETYIYGDSHSDGNDKGINVTDGGLRTNTGKADFPNGKYVSYQVIEDPNGTKNQILRVSTTGGGALYFGYSAGTKVVGGHGMGEICGNVFTMTLELSAYKGKFQSMGNIRMRANAGGGLAKYDQNVLNIGANGVIKYVFNGTSETIHTLSLEGWNKIAFSVDLDEMTIKFYAEEDGVMVCKDEREFVPSKYNSALAAGTPDETSNTFKKSFMNYQRNVELYIANGGSGLTAVEQTALMDMDGDGTPETPIKVTNPDAEPVNVEAQKQYIIDNKSFLVKEISFVAGDIYAK